MLGQRCRRWAKIGPALGQRLVFAGIVERPHCVLNITKCEDIKTVAPLIEFKDNNYLVTVNDAADIKNGLHHIKIHSLYCPQEPFNYGYAVGGETSPVFFYKKLDSSSTSYYYSLRICRDGHLDQSEDYNIS